MVAPVTRGVRAGQNLVSLFCVNLIGAGGRFVSGIGFHAGNYRGVINHFTALAGPEMPLCDADFNKLWCSITGAVAGSG